jgi:hypothetical protein
MNSLKAVFWDYPQFTDKENLQKFIIENKGKDSYYWILKRFIEYGRVIDTFAYFKMEEIAQKLPKLNLTPYAIKKWNRMIEVYGKPDRK